MRRPRRPQPLTFRPKDGKSIHASPSDESVAWDTYFAKALETSMVRVAVRREIPPGGFLPADFEYERSGHEIVAIAAAIADAGVRERRRRYR